MKARIKDITFTEAMKCMPAKYLDHPDFALDRSSARWDIQFRNQECVIEEFRDDEGVFSCAGPVYVADGVSETMRSYVCAHMIDVIDE